MADTWYYTSNYFNSKALEHVLRNTSLSTSNAYIALFSGHPLTFGLSAELSGNGYSRIQAPFTVSGSTAVNTSEVTFPKATGSWYSAVFYGIINAATSGSILFWGLLPTSKQVYTGETFFINAGQLYVGLGGAYSAYLGGNLLNHTLNNISYTSPGLDVFAALYTTLPNANDSGGTEVSAGDYTRLRISGSGWTSINPVYGLDTRAITTSTIDLPFCSDTSNTWGIISGLCLRDSVSAGNQLFRGTFTFPPTVVIGDSYNIKTGDLTVNVG